MNPNLRRALSGLALVLVVLSAACSNDSNEVSERQAATVPADGNVPDEQRWAFDDGEVSRDEYERGFRQFESCADDRGVRLTTAEVDEQSGLIHYMYPDDEAQAAVVEQCYAKHFVEIDAAFQTTDADVLAASRAEGEQLWQTARACLESNGEDVPSAYDEWDPEVADGLMRYMELSNDGRCPNDED